MAGALDVYVGAVEDERGRLSTVLAHMADGVVFADRDGIVRLINPAAARRLEVPAGRVEGQSGMSVLRDHELATAVREVLAGGEPAADPRLVTLGPPSHRRSVRSVVSRIPGGPSSGHQIVLILQDVTDLRQTELIRRDFVANISHELRTPVACLKALVETLEDGALEAPDDAREFLGRMHVEVDGLAQLIAELLELSRIESGQLALHVEPVDLASVVGAAAERLRPQAERVGVDLVLDLPVRLPPASADPGRVQQVVSNLVHNAVKFTEPGGHVRVAAEQRGDEIVVAVSDDGIGIAPELLPRLFERFYKVDRARRGGGTGLGLAIAKHLVQAQGGRIWAASAGEGRGATFTFALPLAQPAAKALSRIVPTR
jgi:two-component system phosphate regulon sensor histidine kinase PhoR